MAVGSINVTQGSSVEPFTSRLLGNLAQARQVRENLLRDFAALDLMRDGGSITMFMALKLGAQGADDPAKVAEAVKLYDEFASLKGYIESEGSNTYGAALLQICAKLGI